MDGCDFCCSREEKETDICEELKIGQNVRISFAYRSYVLLVCVPPCKFKFTCLFTFENDSSENYVGC